MKSGHGKGEEVKAETVIISIGKGGLNKMKPSAYSATLMSEANGR
jgi:hypothetical protein